MAVRVYQGPLERRVRSWFFGADSPAARALRVGIVFLPLALAVVFSFPICPTAALFGLPCPGCGLTRASLALFSGDFAGASALNPLAIVVCPLYVGATLYAIYRYVRRGNVHAESWGAGWLLVISMTALTAVWVARWFGYFGGPVSV